MSRLMWFKGEIVPVEDAKINVLSPTSQFGANVFEGLRAYWSDSDNQLYIFRLEEHLKRLERSVKMMKFNSPYCIEDYKRAILDVIKANNFKEDIAIRQTVFVDGQGSWMTKDNVDMFIAPIAKQRAYDSSIKPGYDCMISSWERINDNSMSPRIKVGANYINSRMGQLEALDNGFDSAIFLNSRKTVSEGPGSCFFMVRDGVLITPPLTASVLESVTRSTVLQIATEVLKLRVEEREIDRTELYIADEAFFCGTAVEIIPIRSVDRFVLNEGQEGSITKELKSKYFEVVRGTIKLGSDWLTPVY
ncbi:branched-chain amino acid aminotransferase [Pseudoalteromonas phenolica]|uniref:Branched-chain-amino-acid aminotransferase n=1 Tax=Pseudoalteromonas phenolica TaxID=161398 RepID=A0A4Q7IR65_9GAMM|nr:branched-chain amino acid transaminase [Pseudoalteromonas phenolica]RZQ54963.1 branched-chain amino acid aminotransferase [Pseudoalteromonas phenolica]